MKDVFLVLNSNVPGWPIVAICESLEAACDWSLFAPGVTPKLHDTGAKDRWYITGELNSEQYQLAVERHRPKSQLPDWKKDCLRAQA